MPCWIFSSIPGLCPAHASSPTSGHHKNTSRPCQLSPGEQSHSVNNHRSNPILPEALSNAYSTAHSTAHLMCMGLWVSHSVVSDSLQPRGLALQAPLSMELSRQEYWIGLSCPSPGESSQPRDQTQVCCIAGRFFTS